MNQVAIQMRVNGSDCKITLPARTMLADLLREHLRLIGTHIGCEHGVCGACTVLIDGTPQRSCIVLAASCEGSDVVTVEGLDDLVASLLREAFKSEHGVQCGFCTPGMLIAASDLIKRRPDADEAEIRTQMSGNLCRCTGYAGIVRAIQKAATNLRNMGVTSDDLT